MSPTSLQSPPGVPTVTGAPPTPATLVDSILVPRARQVASSWRRVVAGLLVGAALGAVLHFVRPKAYLSGGMYVLVSSPKLGKNLGGIGALASQFGLGDATAGMGLNTLAQIGRSEQARATLVQQLDQLATKSPELADSWYGFAGGVPAERTPKAQERVVEAIGRTLDVSVDPRSGTVSMSARAATPALAHATMERFVRTVDSLTASVMSAQARLSRQEAERQVKEAAAELRQAEERARAFLASNRAFSSPNLLFEQQRLEREATLRSTLYTQLAMRFAEASLDEKANTPVLIAVSAPRVPVRPLGPPLRVLLVVGAFLGAAVATVLALWGPPRAARAT